MSTVFCAESVRDGRTHMCIDKEHAIWYNTPKGGMAVKKICILFLFVALLTGCAAAGPALQTGVPSEPSDTQSQPLSPGPEVMVPSGTIDKNPGLTVDPYDPDSQVSELTKSQICRDYCDDHGNLTVDQVRLRFMGVFGETYVMFVDVKDMFYAEVITMEKVGGFTFVYSCSQHMQVWNAGEFYTLAIAYDMGLLTQEDLRTLSLDYYAVYPYLWQYVAMPE